jgi:diaminohydroxyphosphoribosylaminopyrimidine deaminase / 5-amino-6-(5-phosphoribosylamino)uracil reductase
VAGSFLEAGLVDRLALVLAPRVLGDGVGWSGRAAPARMAEALHLEGMTVERLGADLLVSGKPVLARAGRRV